MSEIFIGCDIEDVSRFRNRIKDRSDKFLDKIFTKEEQVYCNSKSDPAIHYAGRFCAKEAVVKAVKSAKKDSQAVKWSCDGSPKFSLENCDRNASGTDVILYLMDEELEYIEPTRIKTLIKKYCDFMPIICCRLFRNFRGNKS